MVFEWMHGKPHSKREAVDVAASAVMMVCFVVLSISALWSDDPPRPLALRICGALGIVALLTRAAVEIWLWRQRHGSTSVLASSRETR
jgi:protein-S-isoprenylcysteine O-methyltransferase Ste14